MKLPVVLYPDKDGYTVAECPLVPGCVSRGWTREEALANIADAIKCCPGWREKLGVPPTIELTEVELPGAGLEEDPDARANCVAADGKLDAARVRQKFAAFIEGWEAPGMEDYDDL